MEQSSEVVEKAHCRLVRQEPKVRKLEDAPTIPTPRRLAQQVKDVPDGGSVKFEWLE